MKKITFLFVATYCCVASVIADDASIVSNWKYPLAFWFPVGMSIPAIGIDNYPRAQAMADSVANFDPTTTVFDDVWGSLTKQGVLGNGYSIANVTGNSLSDKGTADFSGAFKVMYDHDNIYVLLKYTDDNINGSEVVELMWAPYFDIPTIAALASTNTVSPILKAAIPQQASHVRYAQFGGYKANFTSVGLRDAMIVDFDAVGLGSLGLASNNDVLANNVFYKNYTTPGSHVVRAIYTIGYEALTGNAYSSEFNARPEFNTSIWKALNDGKGISFDIHIIDKDNDDQLNSAVPPAEKPQEYWWNSTHNDGWAETYYSGFLGVNKAPTAVETVINNNTNIFDEVNPNLIRLTQNANVEIFNSIGKCIISVKNTSIVYLSNLKSGIYIIRANNEKLRFTK